MARLRERVSVRQSLKEQRQRPSQRRASEEVSKRWVGNTIKNSNASQNQSEMAPVQDVVIPAPTPAIPSKPVVDFMTTIKSMEVSHHELFEMSAKEVKKKRVELYHLNKTTTSHWYTRYIDGRYLMVWRMN